MGHHRLFLALTVMGPVEAAPEYRVIVDANNLTVEIENELSECGRGSRQPCQGWGVGVGGQAGSHWPLQSPSYCPSPASAAVAGAERRRKCTSPRVEVQAGALVSECLLPRLFIYLFSQICFYY